MKAKFLAIVLSLLMLVQPVAAIGMVGVESAAETAVSVDIPAQAETEIANLSTEVEFPEAAPITAILYEDFESKEIGAASSTTNAFAYATNDFAAASVGNNSGVYAYDPAGTNKAIKITADSQHDAIVVLNASIKDAGSYVISYKYYIDAAVSAASTAKFFAHPYLTEGWLGTGFDNGLTANTDSMRKSWQTCQYAFEIYYDESNTRYVKFNAGSTKALTLDFKQFQMFCEIAAASTSNLVDVYIDDVCVTRTYPATVTYVDGEGNTLKTVDAFFGDTITLPTASELGIDYNPVYTIGDKTYVVGDTVIVDSTEMIISVAVPETAAPITAILYEDFESKQIGAASSATNVFTYATKGFTTASVGNNSGVYAYDPAGTNKAMKITADAATDAIVLLNAGIKDAGSYVLSYKYYIDADVSKASTAKFFAHPYLTEGWLGAGFENGLTANTNSMRKSWQTCQYAFEIYYDESNTRYVKYNAGSTKALTYDFRQFQMFCEIAAASTSNLVDVYIDDVCVTYAYPTTVTYVNEAGATLKTVDAFFGDTITLPAASDFEPALTYEPKYIVDDAFYASGDTITLEGDTTVTVCEDFVIINDTFDNQTVGANTSDTFATEVSGTLAANAKWIAKGSAATVAAVDGHGNVLKLPNASWQGARVDGINFVPGVYKVNFDFYVDDVATAAGNGKFHMYHTYDDATGTEIIGEAVGNYKDVVSGWNTAEYQLGIYEKDGKYYATEVTDTWNDGYRYDTNYDYNNDGIKDYSTAIEIGSDVTKINPTLMLQIDGSAQDIYVDNYKVTFEPATPTTVVYTDESGAVLETDITYNSWILLPPAEAYGLDYTPIYMIGGTNYGAREVYTIPADKIGATVSVACMNVPDNAILYENFENVASGYSHANANLTYDVSTASTKTTLGNFYTDTSLNKVEDVSTNSNAAIAANGSKAFRLYNQANPWSLTGFSVNNLPADKVGKYELSFKTFTVYDGANAWSTSSLWYNGATGYSYVNLDTSKWVTYTVPYEVTVVDGVKTVKIEGINSKEPFTVTDVGDNLAKFEFRWINAATTTAGAQSVYLDDVCVTYKAPVTVTYVDEAGETIGTATAIKGDKYTLASKSDLGISYNPIYVIDGVEYYSTYTIPNDASDVEVTVKETNIVLMENFEEVDSNWVYENNGFTYDASTAATKATFINTDRAGVSQNFASVVDTAESETATLAANGTKAFKFGNKVNNYALTGFAINNLPVSEVGDYELTFKTYTVGANGWNSISTYVDADGTYLAIETDKWISWSVPMTVTETDGVKTVNITVMGGTKTLSHEITGDTLGKRLQVLWIGGADAMKVEGNYTMYVDDICLTYKAPAVINATFADSNGHEFALTETATGTYTLPTAEELGVSYVPQYTYNGVTYLPGETISCEEDTDFEFIVKNSNIILMENFENVGSGYSHANANLTYDVSTASTKTTLGNFYTDTTLNKIENVSANSNAAIAANGSKAFRLYNQANQWSLTGFSVNDLPADKVGKYELSFKIFTVYDGTNVWNSLSLYYGGVDPGRSYVALDTSKWVTYTVPYEVTVVDGVKTVKIEGINSKEPFTVTDVGDNLAKFEFRWVNPATTTAGAQSVYLDDVCVKYTPFAPTTVKLAGFRNPDKILNQAGLRFAAYLDDTQKAAATEYGFVATLKTNLEAKDAENYQNYLNLEGITVAKNGTTAGTNNDGVLVVAGAAFKEDVNRVYTTDGVEFGSKYMGITDIFFTGVLYGIDTNNEAQKKAVFVARPYIKVNGVYYYGECHETSYNDLVAAATNA